MSRGRKQKLAPEGFARFVVVLRAFRPGLFEPHPREDAPVVPEIRGEHPGVPHGSVGPHLALDEKPVSIVLPQVAPEVDLPREHLRDPVRHIEAFRVAERLHVARQLRVEQVRADETGKEKRVAYDLHRIQPGRPPRRGIAGGPQMEDAVRVEVDTDARRRFAESAHEVNRNAGPQPARTLEFAHRLRDRVRGRGTQAVVLEHIPQRLAPLQTMHERDGRGRRRHVDDLDVPRPLSAGAERGPAEDQNPGEG